MKFKLYAQASTIAQITLINIKVNHVFTVQLNAAGDKVLSASI